MPPAGITPALGTNNKGTIEAEIEEIQGNEEPRAA
jgi:hypothetical protein